MFMATLYFLLHLMLRLFSSILLFSFYSFFALILVKRDYYSLPGKNKTYSNDMNKNYQALEISSNKKHKKKEKKKT